jgi:hypothetical protein
MYIPIGNRVDQRDISLLAFLTRLVILKIMSKFIEWIKSETIDEAGASGLKRWTSVTAWLFIFFYVVPYLLAFAMYSFGITFKGRIGASLMSLFIIF